MQTYWFLRLTALTLKLTQACETSIRVKEQRSVQRLVSFQIFLSLAVQKNNNCLNGNTKHFIAFLHIMKIPFLWLFDFPHETQLGFYCNNKEHQKKTEGHICLNCCLHQMKLPNGVITRSSCSLLFTKAESRADEFRNLGWFSFFKHDFSEVLPSSFFFF